MKKYFIIGAVVLLGIIGLFLLFSPFKFDKKTNHYLLSHEVLINRPVQKVFDYLGQSKNAANWSVYVDHITPLNAEEYKDGKVGSARRCFKNENEKGIYWDETILSVSPLKERRLSIYNLNGFPITIEHLVTYQHYENLDEHSTRLKFSLQRRQGDMTFFDWIKIKLAGYIVSCIFKKNLAGIKQQLEQQDEY